MSRERRIVRLLGRLRESIETLDEAGPNCTTGYGFECPTTGRAAGGLSKAQRDKAARARKAHQERTRASTHAEVAAAQSAVAEFKETATSLAKSLKRQGASAEEAREAIIAQLQADATEKFLDPPGANGDAPVSPQSASRALADAMPGDRKPDQKKLADDTAVQAATDAVKEELSTAENLDEFSNLLDQMTGDDAGLPARLEDQLGSLGKAMSKSGDWMPAYSPAFKKYAKKGLLAFLKELKGRFQYYTGMITDGISEATQIALSVFPGFHGPSGRKGGGED